LYRSIISTFILVPLLISCGGDKKSPVTETPVQNELLGIWIKTCAPHENGDSTMHFDGTFIFENNIVTMDFTSYESSLCEIEVSSEYNEYEYVIGEELTTSAGNIVTELDIIISNETKLDVFKIEEGYLYFGVSRDDDLRPEAIDFTFWYEKQY